MLHIPCPFELQTVLIGIRHEFFFFSTTAGVVALVYSVIYYTPVWIQPTGVARTLSITADELIYRWIHRSIQSLTWLRVAGARWINLIKYSAANTRKLFVLTDRFAANQRISFDHVMFSIVLRIASLRTGRVSIHLNINQPFVEHSIQFRSDRSARWSFNILYTLRSSRQSWDFARLVDSSKYLQRALVSH
jgi:hypothetical protein